MTERDVWLHRMASACRRLDPDALDLGQLVQLTLTLCDIGGITVDQLDDVGRLRAV